MRISVTFAVGFASSVARATYSPSDGGAFANVGPQPGETSGPSLTDGGAAGTSGDGQLYTPASGGGIHPDTCSAWGSTCAIQSTCCAGLGCAYKSDAPCNGQLCPTAVCCGDNGAHGCTGAGACPNCCSQTSDSNGNCVCSNIGAVCWDNNMCCSNSCSGTAGTPGTCQAAPLQHSCQTVAGCAGTQSSENCSGGVCCGIVDNSCGSNADCCSGNQCVAGKCLISLDQPWCSQPQWTRNQQNAACASNGCNTTTGDCCDNLNQTCAANTDCCPGNSCNGSVCKINNGVGWCGQNSDCFDNDCNLGTHNCQCENPNASCTHPSDCCSGESCDTGLCKTNNGGGCSSNVTCASGNCVSGTCACNPPNGNCHQNSDCCSNVCNGNDFCS